MVQTPTEGFRLSPQQRYVWQLQQASPQQPFYAQAVLRLDGPLDRESLVTAIALVVQRHEILHTTFQRLPGIQFPLQVIAELLAPTLDEHDLSLLDATGQAAAIESLMRAQRQQPVDLDQGPLLRCTLARLSAAQHMLLLHLPALCADAASLALLARELGAAYATARQNAPLPEDPPQYVDLAAWQNELIESEETASGRAFWKQQDLSGLRASTLPLIQPVDPAAPFARQQVALALPAPLAAPIAELAGQGAVSAAAFFLACWQLVLWRFGEQEELIVAVGHEGRKYDELAHALGLFATALPIRGQIDAQMTFDELARQADRALQQADEWQEYFAWEYLPDAQARDGSPRWCPFGFSYAEQPAPHTAGDFTISIERQLACIDRQTLLLACGARGASFDLILHYDAQRCSAADAGRLLAALRIVIEQAARQPAWPLHAYALVDPAEHDRLLALVNPSTSARQAGEPFHERFTAQARRTPDLPAVVFEDETLSYRALDTRTDQLAQHLKALGVGPDVCVGLCVERSLDFIVGLLGVLKAGGAYVPLDPALPPERLRQMLDDIRANVLLTQTALLGPEGTRLPASVQRICLDADWPTIERAVERPRSRPTDPASLAYVLFTSGSTGRPKGVAVEHRQLSAYLDAILERLDISRQMHFALVSTVAADLGNTAIFPALTTGSCLHIISSARAADPDALADYLRQHPIDYLKIVPSHLRALLSGDAASAILPRKRLILGGEASRSDWVRQVQSLMPAGGRIVNHYGPTETTVGVLTLPVDTNAPQMSTHLPLGRPLAGVTAYVLDRHLRPVPVWVPGEIYIGGAQVTRGYLHRPDLTAERFLPDPFSDNPGARLYKTGDRARILPDGTIEFLGRVDHQIKLRGFRVELGEIEAALRQHPAVREAVVLLRDERLVAYVIEQRTKEQAENPELETRNVEPGTLHSALRAYVKDRLPDYMIPSAFVFLDALPLTPNGKLDRRALPAPQPEADTRIVEPPRTPDEELLADLWRQVLGVSQISRADSFFALGGHSLLATQLIARIRTVFQVELPLRVLFETPTLAGLAAQLAALRAEATQPSAAIPIASRDADIPLSLAQQGLWFIAQIAPESGAYTMPLAIRVTGALKIAALQQAINGLVRRHETLRTSFPIVDGQAIQQIAESQPVELVTHDLQALAPDEQQATVMRLAAEDAGRPFDLQNGPLVRVSVLLLSPNDSVLLVALHHLIGDGWSLRVLTRELAALYRAAITGADAELPPLPIQYADYALWQRGWLQGSVREQMIGYWQQQLAGVPPLLELPTDHPRPAVAIYRGATHTFTLPPTLAAAVHSLCQRAGVTPFMTLLAAFQTLLHRYSGQDDIVVGTPIANRTQAETEGLIGLFLNTLALRARLSGGPSFLDLLDQVRDMTLGAYAHQALPFDQVVEIVQPIRNLGYNPLFQVLFMFQNIPTPPVALPGLDVELLEVDSGTSMLDLTFALMETSAGLYGVVEYSTDLFEATTIERLVQHYHTLLERLLPDPRQSIAAVPLLTPAETRQIAAWNATDAAYPETTCLHTLIEAQALRTPQAVAVIFEEAYLTYAELNARANQLAHHLRTLGVGPESRVGVSLHRSIDLIVALLGVLKAGGAYLPLDPSYPRERRHYMLADSDAAALITQEALSAEVPDLPLPVVCLDADRSAIERQPSTSPQGTTLPDNLAYVIYTSGSTGQPKGVYVPHRAVVNFLHSMRRQPGLTERDTLLAVTTLSFDIAALEIFLPLIVGARVVLASREVATDGAQLAAAIDACGATVMQATPATWRMLLDAGWTGNSNLTILCGGEALPRELADQLASRSAALWNLYGPTETTIWSAAAQIAVGTGAVAIGPPIANTRIYLVDSRLQQVPVGVPGEIVIGGAGVARGYHRRPDLTAERFIPDPFSGTADARLYRTGDLARYRQDGTLEFLGRIDHQIKLRGYRIELGEIEAILNRHPAIRQSVVLVREDRPGDQRLVAYVVGEQRTKEQAENPELETRNVEPGTLHSALRAYVKDHLPDYMVPSAFVVLDALPLTPNGKVDRRALPAPDGTLSAHEQTFVGPRTPTEEVLAGIWAAVLGRAQVGVHDHFFELGGHSLLITQVMSRIQAAFQVKLPLRALFEAPTITELARRVDLERHAARGMAMPALRRAPRQGELPLSFAQQRLWFLDQLEPNSPFYNIPVALRLDGTLDSTALERALNAIVGRHEALRTTFPNVQGRAAQVIAPTATINLALVDLRNQPPMTREARIKRLAAEEARQPFDLAHGPLLRATLVRADDAEHILLVTMHHITSDGWSMGIFVQELAALYRACASGAAEPERMLPELPIQYADYAIWQREWLHGAVLDEQLAYWKQQLSDLPTLDLPTDHPRPPVQSFHGATQRFEISAPVTEALRALSRREGVTLFMTLLATWQTLLARYSGQRDIVVGTPIAGRTHAETESLIGFFVNTLVLRTNLTGDPGFRELLARVRDVALEAYAHQDLPFEMLVDELQPERDMSRNPLFQVLFALQNMPMPAVELPDLRLESIPAESGAAKFDLWLALREGPDTLLGTLEYATDLFDASTIARMIDHFQQLLMSIADEPDRPVSQARLLSDAERRTMLVEWNTIASAPSLAAQDACLHQLVEAQAQRTPDAVAVIDGTARVTYRELNERANQVAHWLQARGVGGCHQGETPVGICVERSAALVAGVLGILKAGGAYVPLDPAYPQERLAFMLADSRAMALITQRHLSERLPAHGLAVLHIDQAEDLLAQLSRATPTSGVTPDNLAYVIYTSGSTGLPKGVPIAHHSPVNLVTWATATYTSTELAGVLFSTSICFDLSVFELFVPLSCGGCVIIAENALHLPDLAAAQQVTLINTVPSAAAELVRISGIPASARTINLAGEPLPLHLAQQLYQQTPVHQVVNLYGPSETTTYSTWMRIPREIQSAPPIGRPLAQTQIYLLDRALQPVPIGVLGEVYIGGSGLARGYLNRAELAAEKFVPDPFGATPGGRLYRTGDLARYLPDGTLEFAGRIDHQIKIRGFRIELGEIEATLHQHPAVRDAVAVVRDDGGQRLVAYVVAEQRGREAGDVGLNSELGPLATDQVDAWQDVFNTAYHETSPSDDPTFNIAGWRSSYTGAPLPAETMREWVDQTVERIQALRPRRVLEIGCGTGLLLFRIAPGSERYVATDLAQAAIDQLQRQTRDLPQVRLLQRAADDFSGLEASAFDVVIINSVAQYFPSLDYLVRVLESALHVLAPGGAVFLGDVRSFPLLEAFHAAVELHQAPPTLTIAQFRQRVQRRLIQENELTIAPAFFLTLRQRYPQIGQVAIQLKGGRFHSEVTQFRYDVALRLDERASREPLPWRDWPESWLTTDALRQVLRAEQPERLGLRRVPNTRIASELRLLELIEREPPTLTVAELRHRLSVAAIPAIDPADLSALGAELGYTVALRWSGAGDDGCYEAIFRRASAGQATDLWSAAAADLPDLSAAESLTAYANHPLQARLTRELTPVLRGHLRERLPEYMVPSAFVILDAVPLTPNGKVDREALPAPLTVPELEAEIVPPRTPLEQTLAEIWAQILGVEQVGIHNNFFGLGGDSILSLQVIARAQQAGLRITPRQMFQHQTIAELAAALGASAQMAEQQLFPLAPGQRCLVEHEQLAPDVVQIETPPGLDAARLAIAVDALLRQQAALRLRLVRGESGWRQQIAAPSTELPFSHIDLTALPPDAYPAALADANAVAQREIDPASGRLLHVSYLDRGPGLPGRLLLVGHPLALDRASWSIVARDLWTAYEQQRQDQPIELPAPAATFQQWIGETSADITGSAQRGELDHWLAIGRAEVARLPQDGPSNGEAAATIQAGSGQLSAEETRQLLDDVHQAYHTQVTDLLLAALAQSITGWTGGTTLLVDLEGDGRAATTLDLSRTIGCFTTVFPALLALPETADQPAEVLKTIKEQLRRIPRQGLGYGILRADDQLRGLPQAELRFVYGSAADQLIPPGTPLALAPEADEPIARSRTQRPYLLEVSARIVGNQLRLIWSYDAQVYQRTTVERLSQAYLDALRALIAHCRAAQGETYTPSDFPKAKLSQKDLDKLMGRLSKPGNRRTS
ncbi:MAG TPA: amino acid adenylation domain-containing protein [Herpetosiphonaceae bacterium]